MITTVRRIFRFTAALFLRNRKMIDEEGMTPEQRREALLATPGLDPKAKEALQFTITPEALDELAANLAHFDAADGEARLATQATEALQLTMTPEALDELAAKLARLEDPTAPGRAAYEREDYKMAVLLWRPLAERGNIDAQFYLGSAYFIGNGVPQNFVLAHMWSNLAAAGSPAAQTSNSRDRAIETRDMVFGLMTPEQVAEAQRLASEWKPIFP
jgi:hypothetical protein